MNAYAASSVGVLDGSSSVTDWFHVVFVIRRAVSQKGERGQAVINDISEVVPIEADSSEPASADSAAAG